MHELDLERGAQHAADTEPWNLLYAAQSFAGGFIGQRVERAVEE